MSSVVDVGLQQFLIFSPGPRTDVQVWFAPGRVNLIGEHTDYNGGYVLPAALHLGTWLFVRQRNDDLYRFASTMFDYQLEVSGKDELVFRKNQDFANYPLAVISEFRKLGKVVPGLDIFYAGNLPPGAGLSSSASVEVVTAAMLNDRTGAALSREELALLSQRAENRFVGVNSGIMDQFAVAMGMAGRALSLNCETLEYTLVPMKTEKLQIVIANTNKRRGLVDSKYNNRRLECDAAVNFLRQRYPNLHYLAELSPEQWQEVEPTFVDDVLKRRARHVVLESHRAKVAREVLGAGDVDTFGRMMNESHQSLRDDFEVTGPELDALAEAAWSVPGCIGSRMTGAGFGGCTVSLVQTTQIDTFTSAVKDGYEKRIGLTPTFYVTAIGDGVREVTRLFQ